MSLLDDVSIVVTPNGYKAGTLFGVIPVPTVGTELVPDGNFTNQAAVDYWQIASSRATKSLESGFMRLTYDVATGSALYKNNLATVGKNYLVTFRSKGTANSKFVSIGDNNSLGNNPLNPVLTSDWQDYKFIVPLSTGITFRFYLDSAQIGDTLDITNISVKEYTAADMDVTRATAATRVDENGLVNYAEVLGGEEITCGDLSCAVPLNYWVVPDGNVTFSSGAIFDVDTKMYQNNIIVAGTVYKFTYEITENTGGMTFRFYNGASYNFVDDSVGVHTVYFTGAGTNHRFYLSTLSGTSLTLKSVSVKEVTRDNVPRIDYTGGGCPHILAEPMRTNLIPYSEDFSQWLIYDTITRTANYGTSPDGTQNSFKIGSSGASNDFMYLSLSLSASQSYSLSFFIKNVDSVESKFFTPSESTTTITWSGSGITSISDGTYESFGNGWYKITSAATSQSDGGYISRFYPSTSGTASVELYGYQLEQGSYATSYIPNFGTAAGVTRNQDIFTRDGIGSLINSTEGVLFAEIAALYNDVTYREISLNDGTTNNVVEIRYTPTDNQFQFVIRNAGAAVVVESITLSNALDFNKIAFSYKSNDYKMYVNGVQVATDTSGAMPSGLNALSLDWGGNYFYGKVKQLQVYDTALTDEQLLQLTGESGTDFYESYAEMASALTYTIQ